MRSRLSAMEEMTFLSVDSYGRRQLVVRDGGEEKENYTCSPAEREGPIREIESGYVES